MTIVLPSIIKVSIDRPELPAILKVNNIVFKVKE